MTIARRGPALRRDQATVRRYIIATIGMIAGRTFRGVPGWQPKRVPWDYPLFGALARNVRSLASPLPGWAAHSADGPGQPPFFERWAEK